MIALALSGGGSRAIAFHLGCLRALHDRDVLEKVSVISSVSGGSVIAALYAYGDSNFENFDNQVVSLLRKGLHRSILRYLFLSPLVLGALATNLIARPVALMATACRKAPPFRRWISRTDALERALRHDLFGDAQLSEVKHPQLATVINACELRTGTAFRFGNQKSGSWRTGEILDNKVSVAHAVACSAAYPMMLPAFDRFYPFRKGGQVEKKRVLLTDGGVFDNLGTSCLEPGRNDAYSLHVFNPDYIICCYAGHGQFSGDGVPFGFPSRAIASFESVFRKVQDAAVHRLHLLESSGQLKGFVLSYLGQQDSALPFVPPDLVKRDAVFGYPTDFAAMRSADIERISMRGEQLTRMLLAYYCPEL
jgi:NTE family protein